MIVAEVLKQTACRLRPRAGEAARLEAELLLAEVRGQSRARLLSELRRPVSAPQLAALEELVKRRLEGEPVAYLLGRREFMSLEFQVGPGVLVPRPETEVLVEKALEILKRGRWRRPVVVDVGTGCGNIALSLAHYFPRARVMGTDISPAALRMARLNARRLGLSGRVGFYRGDLLRPLLGRKRGRWGRGWMSNPGPVGFGFPPGWGVVPARLRPSVVPSAGVGARAEAHRPTGRGKVTAGTGWVRPWWRPLRADLVVANLPYIRTDWLERLPPEVQCEPRLALDGGPDGLAVYRRLLKQLGGLLRPGGYLALEVSPEQETPLRKLLAAAGCRRVVVVPDVAGRPRVLSGRFFPRPRRELRWVCSISLVIIGRQRYVG